MQYTTRIRTATPDDFERIVELENLCFPKEHAYTRRQLHYLLIKANSTVLVETTGTLVRGFLIILYGEEQRLLASKPSMSIPSIEKKVSVYDYFLPQKST